MALFDFCDLQHLIPTPLEFVRNLDLACFNSALPSVIVLVLNDANGYALRSSDVPEFQGRILLS